MKKTPKYYKDRVCLNVLTQSKENAQDLINATEGHILLGLLSKDYDNIEDALTDISEYQKLTNNAISIGLGGGDARQWQVVSEISEVLQPQHVNQIFSATGYTRAKLQQDETVVNSLVSPCGKVGYVNIATGHLSSKYPQAIVPIETAIELMKEMGASSIKYFPMKGLSCKEEYQAVCKAAAKSNFMVEPTGGIDLDNFEEIVKIALDAKVPKVIPHVYSSIIDKESKLTSITDVEILYQIIKKLV
ncbi:MAG: 2-dehydro-3-deoxy-phosphogluconate aldolase [Erysipelotrichaceae bacterium]